MEDMLFKATKQPLIESNAAIAARSETVAGCFGQLSRSNPKQPLMDKRFGRFPPLFRKTLIHKRLLWLGCWGATEFFSGVRAHSGGPIVSYPGVHRQRLASVAIQTQRPVALHSHVPCDSRYARVNRGMRRVGRRRADQIRLAIERSGDAPRAKSS